MKKKALLLVGGLAQLATGNALDLVQAYHKALAYNANYLQAIATNQAGQEQPRLARAALLPQLNATASISEAYFNQSGVQATYHQPIYAAQLNQVIFDFSKFSQYIKAKFTAAASELQLVNAQQSLMVQVIQAYFNVLYAEDTLLATQMTKTALARQLTQAQAAFEAGTVTIADVNDAQAGYDAAVAQEIQDTNNLIAQKNIFYNITGCDAVQIQPLQETIALQAPAPSTDGEWAKMAVQANLNNQIAAKQLDMARQDISIARSGHYPTLAFNLQYMYQDTGALDSTNANQQQLYYFNIPGGPLSNYSVGSAGVQLQIPIFAGGGINAKTRQAIANYETAQQQQASINRQTDQNVRNAFWQVQNGVNLVTAQKAALVSAKTKLDADQLGYQVGVRNSVDLVSAQKNYYQTFQTYQQSRYQYLMAEVQLEYLSGKINDNFIQNLNSNLKD